MMKYFGEGLSEKHKELGKIIRKKDEISQAKFLFLDIHANLHLSETEGTIQNEVDNLIRDLKENECLVSNISLSCFLFLRIGKCKQYGLMIRLKNRGLFKSFPDILTIEFKQFSYIAIPLKT